MKKLCLALVFVAFAATPSPALLDAIHAFRTGATSGAPSASNAQGLSAPENDALMFWINAHGRGPLHALGVSDEQIGIPLYPIDYTLTSAPWPSTVPQLAMASPMPANTPTPAPHHAGGLGAIGGLLGAALPALQIPVASSSSSSSSSTTTNIPGGTETNSTYSSSSTSVSVGVNPWGVVSSLIDASSANAAPQPPSVPWRSLLFAASTLGDGGSGITVTHGFAAVRNDGTEGLACISFMNNNQKVANEIDVDIEVLDTNGFIRRVAPLRLTGSFAPGAEIGGPKSVEDVNAARANCVIDGEHRLDDPTDPFSGASAVVYAVRRVQFADGTTWLQPGANPWT
ncbi:MAG TPA: hypothetical protein VF741_07650 [Candidatus Aquilonibacter sp.]